MTVSKEPCEAQYKPRLGHYQLDKPLGRGNYAVVRLAVHCITGTKVCICFVVQFARFSRLHLFVFGMFLKSHYLSFAV